MKPLLIVSAGLLAVVAVVAAYFVYAPMPESNAAVLESRTLTVGDLPRSFMVYTPPNLHAKAPLLLVLHGSLMDGPNMQHMLGGGFERLARQHGAVVVYPTGHEGHFNDGRVAASYSAKTLNIDDVGFVRAMVSTLATAQKIDPQKVYAFGYSNGGHMAMRLAAEAPELIAGIIVSNANVPTPDNMGWKVLPGRTKVVLIEGTKDRINPHDGGRVTIFGFGDRGTVLSAPDSALWFAQRAGIGIDPLSDTLLHMDALDVRQREWGFPARVRLVSMYGAGHTVPQADYRFPRFLGATVRDDAILESAWTFVSTH